MAGRLKPQKTNGSDEFQTPPEAIRCLLPYLPYCPGVPIWECAYGEGMLARAFSDQGFNVIGKKDMDFLTEEPKDPYEYIITNPPYSLKMKFLKRAYELNKPFAFLLPLTTLEGVNRGSMFAKNGIQLLIPNHRINFITPSGKGSGAWFSTAWFTHQMNLPRELNFVEL